MYNKLNSLNSDYNSHCATITNIIKYYTLIFNWHLKKNNISKNRMKQKFILLPLSILYFTLSIDVNNNYSKYTCKVKVWPGDTGSLGQVACVATSSADYWYCLCLPEWWPSLWLIRDDTSRYWYIPPGLLVQHPAADHTDSVPGPGVATGTGQSWG